MSDERRPDIATLKDRRWTLCRALAWIVTRDIEKVRELATDAELVSLFMCVAFWRDDGVPLHSEPNAAWALLAKRIAAGEVEAHGRAFENNLKIGKREPIGSVADGFALGDLYSEILAFPGANLEDKHSSARIVDIVVRVRDLGPLEPDCRLLQPRPSDNRKTWRSRCVGCPLCGDGLRRTQVEIRSHRRLRRKEEPPKAGRYDPSMGQKRLRPSMRCGRSAKIIPTICGLPPRRSCRDLDLRNGL